MVLTLIQMEERAKQFYEDFKDASDEHSEAQEFWLGFFNIFGIEKRKTDISFEYALTKINGKKGYIDCFWPSRLIVEHKSKGINLDMAYKQLLDYTISLPSEDIPRYAIVSDFQKIRLKDFDTKDEIEFELKDLYQYIPNFEFIYSFNSYEREPEEELKIKASKIMGDLHDSLKGNHYPEEDLEQFLTRLLFCLYAEDTGIFNKNQFENYIFGEDDSKTDFTRTGGDILELFSVLDRDFGERDGFRKELKDFPYVNGNLFSRTLQIPSFNLKMFNDLKKACRFNWAKISPAIFGSLYQYVVDEEIRRQQGAHYTDENNVMKVINSLFLHDLKIEFEQAGANVQKLEALRNKMGNLKFFDPACGCGNFLIIAYRELRLLELEILKKILYGGSAQRRFNGSAISVIRVENFYGIEISEAAFNISKIAMWFIEHQMNLKFDSIDFHEDNLPLKSEVNIIRNNALRIDWADVLKPDNNVYILSNPPFAGKSKQTNQQKEDMKFVFEESLIDEEEFKEYSNLDYVAAWYKKALDYIDGTNIEVAFVSTNSICQGEQVPILWKQLHEHYTFYINFAHQTFRWSNEAERNAGVFVIIIGFSMKEREEKALFTYENPNSSSEQLTVENINSYLVDYDDLIIEKRHRKPISDVPPIRSGSKPIDDGNLILSEMEKRRLCHDEPISEKFIKRLITAKEYINGENMRWCLWLVDVSPSELKAMPSVVKRIEKVREFRLASERDNTVRAADTPSLFAEIRQPTTDYIIIPSHSSENREYIPMGFVEKDNIANNSTSFVESDDKYVFGVLTSKMHMAWVSYVCGRIKGDYRYSNTIVYNNFPFPREVSEVNKDKVRECCNKVLEVRESFPGESLADLYSPQLMPPALINAHKDLDKAVDKCYRSEKFEDDMDRIKFLFDLYLEYTSD